MNYIKILKLHCLQYGDNCANENFAQKLSISSRYEKKMKEKKISAKWNSKYNYFVKRISDDFMKLNESLKNGEIYTSSFATVEYRT